jgi:hypothetical protein
MNSVGHSGPWVGYRGPYLGVECTYYQCSLCRSSPEELTGDGVSVPRFLMMQNRELALPVGDGPSGLFGDHPTELGPKEAEMEPKPGVKGRRQTLEQRRRRFAEQLQDPLGSDQRRLSAGAGWLRPRGMRRGGQGDGGHRGRSSAGAIDCQACGDSRILVQVNYRAIL